MFTRAFLKTLRNNKKVMDGYQLYRALRHRVVLNAEQTPEYSDVRLAEDEGGDYLFVPSGSTVVAVTTMQVGSVDERALDLAFWEGAKDSIDPAAFEAYLEKSPNGVLSILARLRLESLKADGPASPISPTPPTSTR